MAIIQYKTPGYTTTLGACAATAGATPLEFYYDTSVTPTLVAIAGATPGTILYNQNTFDTEFDGNNDWWALITDASTPTCQIIQISEFGEVLEISEDICPPVITLNGNATENLTVGATWTDPGATATDGCDGNIVTITVGGDTVDLNSAGTYEITYNVSDAAGNAATQVTRSVTVNVVDTTAPVITVTGANPATFAVGATYTDAGATANGGETVTSSGTVNTSVVGTYTITYSATDAANNTGTATRTVNVVDTTAPVITLIGSATVSITAGDTYADLGADASDNIDGDISDEIITVGIPADTNTAGTYIITYNVSDEAGNSAVEVTRTLTIVDNAPVANSGEYNVDWNGIVTITLSGVDDIDTSLVYAIATQPTKGTISLVGNVATYTHTATLAGGDSFTFTVTDSSNQTSVPATIIINPTNAAPVINNPGQQTLDQNSSIVFYISVDDDDGSNVGSIQNTSLPTNGTISQIVQDGNTFSAKYTPNLGYYGSDAWQIKVTDSRGVESAPLTINFNVEFSATLKMDISSFGSDPAAMCLATRGTPAYISTEQANSVLQLQVGDSIYYDESLLSKVTPGTIDTLVSVSDINGAYLRVLRINTNGQIAANGITECDNSAESNYADVKYATSTTEYCNGDYQLLKIWYNGADQKTLSQLVLEGVPLFTNEYSSNLYTGSGGDTVTGFIASGIYSDLNEEYYKRSLVNDWAEAPSAEDEYGNAVNYKWECGAAVNNVVYELIVKKSDISDPTINEFCNSENTDISLWYVMPEGSSAFSNLLSLAQFNTPVYKSQLGATDEDPDDLFDSNIFSDSTGYLVWDNPGDGFNLRWYGYNLDGQTVLGSAITNYGTCSDYVRPVIENNTVGNESVIDNKKIFYGFYSLTPEIDVIQDSQTGVLEESLFWPIYVIDGLHTTPENYADSYIGTFIASSAGLNQTFGKVLKSNNFHDCLEYAVRITAEDMDEAVLLLKASGIIDEQRPVVSDGTEIGLSSESIIEIYDNSNSSKCAVGDESMASQVYIFPFIDGYESVSIGPNFKTETNYRLDNVAKPLLRTNPKLSGNVKLVTSSDGSIYIESISASKDLASVKYKKNPINPNGNYASDVANFFKKNDTTTDLIYLTKRSNSDLTVLDAYDKQIEEEYQYGTVYNYSKNYSESYRIFAPIWADNNLPNNFIVFRVKNPSGVDAAFVTADGSARIQEVLKNAEIIKTFDLSNNSNLGKYIRSHVQQETFPKSPLTVSFGKNEVTNFNGIDISSGELTSKGEYIYKDFIETDKPLIEANDFITDGFRRNGILCANLLNLEFLFDDDSAEDYTINRYFGLYVDAIDSGFGEINSISNNTIKFSEVTSLVNPSIPETAIPSYKQMSTTPTLGYVQIDGIYYKISNSGIYDPLNLEVKINDSTGNIPAAIGISENGRSVDLIKNEERGYDFVKMSIINVPESNDKIAAVSSREEAYKFNFVKHISGETISINIDDSTGTYQFTFTTGATLIETAANMQSAWDDLNISLYLKLEFDHVQVGGDYHETAKSFVIYEELTNLGDLNMSVTGAIGSIIRVDQIQTNVNIQNRTYVANYALPKGTYSGKFFSNQGTLGDIASALAGVIHSDDSSLDAYNIGSDLWVKARVPGYRLLQHAVLVNKQNTVDFIDVKNKDTKNILKLRVEGTSILSQWNAHYLIGGNSSGKSIFINNTTLSEIAIGDYLQTRLKGVFNRVLDIVEDISVPNSTRSKLILEDKSDVNNGEANVLSQNVVKIGLFSAYDIYDMNFDFYDTANSDLKELVHETRSKIAYEPYERVLLNVDPITGQYDTVLEPTDIFGDDYSLEPINYFSNLSGILSEESVGENNVEIISSEFDRLKENQLKEFSINSRVVPNINKWVLKNSLTVKDQPYYLNTSEAFGRTNFSPDLSATSRSKDDMTHEWFYMDKKPEYLRYDELNDTFSYVNFIEDFELTPSLFKSTRNNYFDKFMITEGFEKNLSIQDLENIYNVFGKYNSAVRYLNPSDINNTFFKTNLKKKYTLIDGGDGDAFASTIFKGLKVVLKNRKEYTNKTALDFVKSSEFNGYKFSILLKTNTNVDNNDVEFEVIQNKKFKFVIFFITLNIGDYWIKGNMNRRLLYELKHKIVYDHGIEDYTYANTPFDGALSWNTANLVGGSPYVVNGINHFNGSVPDFENQLVVGENGLYGDILMDVYPDAPGSAIYRFSIYSIENSDTIKVVGPPVNVNDPGDILDVTYLPNYIQKKIKYSYVDGGTNIHEVVLNKISINKVAKMINLNDDSVKYTTVEEDGSVVNNRFVINLEDGTEIVKYATLSTEEDNDKPKSYKLFKGIIGYNLVRSSEASYYPFLVRHSGAYTVDFRPVITFTDMYTHFKSNRVQASADSRETGFEKILYKHSIANGYELTTAKSYYNRYNRCGTTFNVGFIQDGKKHDNSWGLIKNQFYHKVNETNPTGITKLSESSDKLPLYPLIDEISISKKDINVFRSSWDAGYYTRALSGGNSEDVPGTLDNTEERSYLASTVMKIKDNYTLTSFNYKSVDSVEELDEILKNSINQAEVLFFEDEKEIIADFYITDISTRLLSNDGVLKAITQYVSAQNSAGDRTTLTDDANFYIDKNIISQFVVDSIQLFTKRFKGSASTIVNTENINLIGEGGFSPDNNFTFKPHKQKPMNFRLIYNKRLGYSYNIKPMIKIKS
jgi:hypothetical protein